MMGGIVGPSSSVNFAVVLSVAIGRVAFRLADHYSYDVRPPS